ncbi:hypothetical protein [Sphingomonas bacterium]|uniref:hypothetical protein n=1 Tax=Sphingomonas bacterium TaxID=1895847 RepID=UPI001575CCD4|nr:hypothetical protein [Sphingomonas bacterium]
MLSLVLLAQAADPSPALRPIESITHQPCPSGQSADVIVCGNNRDRYRLPLPAKRDPVSEPQGPRADSGSGLAAITPVAPCGIFSGERRCGKAEAAQYGYGGGRDPVTVLVKVGKALINPDAGPLPTMPSKPR